MNIKNLIFLSFVFMFILVFSFNVNAVIVNCKDPYNEMNWQNQYYPCSLATKDCLDTSYCVWDIYQGILECKESNDQYNNYYKIAYSLAPPDDLVNDRFAPCINSNGYSALGIPSNTGYWADCDRYPFMCKDYLYEGPDCQSYVPYPEFSCPRGSANCGESSAICSSLGEYTDTTTLEYCGDDTGEQFNFTTIKNRPSGPYDSNAKTCCNLGFTGCASFIEGQGTYNKGICLPSTNNICKNLSLYGVPPYGMLYDTDYDYYIDYRYGGQDCDDSNNRVNPSAVEFCEDGIDNNCNGEIDEINCINPNQICTLTDVRISSTCSPSCWEGDTITLTAEVTAGIEGCAATYLQINGEGESCSILHSNGDMIGMGSNVNIPGSGPGIQVSETWTIPTIPSNCLGNRINATTGQLWIGEPGVGTLMSSLPATRYFILSSSPPVPQPCNLTNAYWARMNGSSYPNNFEESNNTNVQLILEGSNCNGKQVNFSIFESKDGCIWQAGGDEYINTVSTNFVSDKATATWLTEWQQDGFFGFCGLPEFYFNANLTDTGEGLRSGLLRVNTTQNTQPCGGGCPGNELCCNSDANYYCNATCPSTGLNCIAPALCCSQSSCTGVQLGGLSGCSASEVCCLGSCEFTENNIKTIVTRSACRDDGDGDTIGVYDETRQRVNMTSGAVLETSTEQKECTLLGEVNVSFFTLSNIIIVVILLVGYYLYVNLKKKKK